MATSDVMAMLVQLVVMATQWMDGRDAGEAGPLKGMSGVSVAHLALSACRLVVNLTHHNLTAVDSFMKVVWARLCDVVVIHCC